jgi:hypothetical protein
LPERVFGSRFTLQQRLTDGNNWSRRQWAEARLTQRFSKRIPAAVNLTISQAAPTFIARSFDEGREIPETRVSQMLEQVLSSPLFAETGKLVQRRIGRPLEPFDIWYNGFRPRSAYTEAQLDEIVRKKYPTAEAYKQDIPNLLVKLGFSKERADYLANNIVVDPARGSGHAMGANMRSAKVHLRTRVGANGMDYKGYNIAVEESHRRTGWTRSIVARDGESAAGRSLILRNSLALRTEINNPRPLFFIRVRLAGPLPELPDLLTTPQTRQVRPAKHEMSRTVFTPRHINQRRVACHPLPIFFSRRRATFVRISREARNCY